MYPGLKPFGYELFQGLLMKIVKSNIRSNNHNYLGLAEKVIILGCDRC